MNEMEEKDEEEFEVKKIVGERVINGKTYYKVRWLGYTPKHDSWEPLKNLGSCQALLDDFKKKGDRCLPSVSKKSDRPKKKHSGRRKSSFFLVSSSDEEANTVKDKFWLMLDKGEVPLPENDLYSNVKLDNRGMLCIPYAETSGSDNDNLSHNKVGQCYHDESETERTGTKRKLYSTSCRTVTRVDTTKVSVSVNAKFENFLDAHETVAKKGEDVDDSSGCLENKSNLDAFNLSTAEFHVNEVMGEVETEVGDSVDMATKTATESLININAQQTMDVVGKPAYVIDGDIGTDEKSHEAALEKSLGKEAVSLVFVQEVEDKLNAEHPVKGFGELCLIDKSSSISAKNDEVLLDSAGEKSISVSTAVEHSGEKSRRANVKHVRKSESPSEEVGNKPRKKVKLETSASDTSVKEKSAQKAVRSPEFNLAALGLELSQLAKAEPPELGNFTNDDFCSAVSKNDMRMLRYALEKADGIWDVEQPDEAGKTLVMAAIQNGNSFLVRLLVKQGAKINARMKDGTTPLMIAAQGGSCKAVNLLLFLGARINDRTLDGETSLIKAVRAGHYHVVYYLLDNGANFSPVAVSDVAVLDFVKNDEDLCFLILQHIQNIELDFESSIAAALKNAGIVVRPLFPLEIVAIRETKCFTMSFRYDKQEPYNKSCFCPMLFIGHANVSFQSMNCSLRVLNYAVKYSVLNGHLLKCVEKEEPFCFTLVPLCDGINHLSVYLKSWTNPKVKLVMRAYQILPLK